GREGAKSWRVGEAAPLPRRLAAVGYEPRLPRAEPPSRRRLRLQLAPPLSWARSCLGRQPAVESDAGPAAQVLVWRRLERLSLRGPPQPRRARISGAGRRRPRLRAR